MDVRLTKLPALAQVGAFVALAIAGVVVFYTVYEHPLQAALEQREVQLGRVRKDIATGRAAADRLDDFRAQLGELERRVANLQMLLPQETDAAALLRSMQTVAMQSGLSIRLFKPEVPIAKPFHAEWPIALEIDGTYHDLAVFFDRVGRFTPIVNISALQIQAKDTRAQSATISARCVATTFVLLEALPPHATGAGTTKGDEAAAQ